MTMLFHISWFFEQLDNHGIVNLKSQFNPPYHLFIFWRFLNFNGFLKHIQILNNLNFYQSLTECSVMFLTRYNRHVWSMYSKWHWLDRYTDIEKYNFSSVQDRSIRQQSRRHSENNQFRITTTPITVFLICQTHQTQIRNILFGKWDPCLVNMR